VALLAMLVGGTRISRYWLCFCVTWGVICVVPFWPHKDGSLLPLGTPYVNFGGTRGVGVLLAMHTLSAALIAAALHWLVKRNERSVKRCEHSNGQSTASETPKRTD
jgi:hypothetical protein